MKIIQLIARGKVWDRVMLKNTPVEKTYTYTVTGSRLSVRKKIKEAVDDFMKEHKIGACTITQINC